MAMARARCLPMNFHPEDVTGILKSRDQARGGVIGGSLADVDPMTIDTKVSNLENLGYTCPDISSRQRSPVLQMCFCFLPGWFGSLGNFSI